MVVVLFWVLPLYCHKNRMIPALMENCGRYHLHDLRAQCYPRPTAGHFLGDTCSTKGWNVENPTTFKQSEILKVRNQQHQFPIDVDVADVRDSRI